MAAVRWRKPFMRTRLLPGALALLASAAAACGDDRPPMVPELARLLEDRSRHAVHIGLPSDTSRAATLGIVAAARVTASGNHIVILDVVPPFVKVFTRTGALRGAFLERGPGPGELRVPAALATAGDTALLVADITGRLSVLDFNGRVLAQATNSAFHTLAAGWMCGGWVLYGPHFDLNGTSHWLHRTTFQGNSELRTVSLFRDSSHPDMLPVGRPYGLAIRGADLLLRHDLGTPPTLVNWTCSDTTALVIERLGSEFVRNAFAERSILNKVRAFTLRSGARTSAGLAFVGDDVLLADVVLDPSLEGGGYTVFQLLTGDRVARAGVPGMYLLRDSRPGVEVLLSTAEPVPAVFLLDADTLTTVLLRTGGTVAMGGT